MNNDMTEHSSKTQGSYTASATSLQTNASKQTGLLVIVKKQWNPDAPIYSVWLENTLHERNAAVKPYLQHGNKAK